MGLIDFAYDSQNRGVRGPRLQIVSDSYDRRAEFSADAAAAGFRVKNCYSFDEVAEADIIPNADIVLVEFRREEFAPWLERVDEELAKQGGQLIIICSRQTLDTAFCYCSKSQPQLLVDATRTEAAFALGQAALAIPEARVREREEPNNMLLLRLVDQVNRLASRLEGLGRSEGLDFDDPPRRSSRRTAPFAGNGIPPIVPEQVFGGTIEAQLPFTTGVTETDSWSDSSVPDEPRAAEAGKSRRPPLPDPRLVRSIIRQRQARARYFDGDLFSDPAWDMMLDLTAARAEHRRVSVTSVCIASGAPPTTALRWIAQLVAAGLFVRIEDDTDKRRAFIALTDKASDAMARYFADTEAIRGYAG